MSYSVVPAGLLPLLLLLAGRGLNQWVLGGPLVQLRRLGSAL